MMKVRACQVGLMDKIHLMGAWQVDENVLQCAMPEFDEELDLMNIAGEEM